MKDRALKYLQEHIDPFNMWDTNPPTRLDIEQALVDFFKTEVRKFMPEKVELPEFDLTKKNDHIYCVEWGMKKARKTEYEVFQKMLSDKVEFNTIINKQNKHES